jgi:hypothetical protein
MPFLCEVKGPQAVAGEFIARASWDGVLRLCVQWSGKDDYEVADEINISHGTMSKVLKGTAGLWGARLVKFMRTTENLAPLQWLADQMGCDVIRRAPLESEVERSSARTPRRIASWPSSAAPADADPEPAKHSGGNDMRSVDLSHAQAAPAPHTARLAELVANDVRDTVLAQSLLRILEDHRSDGDRWLRMQTARLIEQDRRVAA